MTQFQHETETVALTCVKFQITSTIIVDGLQSIPREPNDKDVAAMLDELTIEANDESFVIVLQHGGNDATCKRSIGDFRVSFRLCFKVSPSAKPFIWKLNY